MDGWIPIIAHPERHQVIQRNPHALFQLIETGALAQVNAGSLRGDFGTAAQTTAWLLLHHNLVHVVASDAHSQKKRRPEISDIEEILSAEGIEKADLLIRDIPEAILSDRAVPDLGEARDPSRTRPKFFDFLKRKKKGR